MNFDTLRGALRSKTMVFNGAALGLFGIAPTLFGDTAVVQAVISVLPPQWQTVAMAGVTIFNFYLRTKTTQSLADKVQ